MTKRERLEAKKQKNFEKIEELKRQNIELTIESLLLSDKVQWFTEESEDRVVSKRPKKVETFLIGKIHWNETFKDKEKPDGSGDVVIKRSQIVRVSGKWM
jgi:hypothetical protein